MAQQGLLEKVVGGWRLLRWVVRPLRELVVEVRGLRVAVEELLKLQRPPGAQVAQGIEGRPAVAGGGDELITYTSDAEQVALEEIAATLARAKGVPPSEEEVLEEFSRRGVQ